MQGRDSQEYFLYHPHGAEHEAAKAPADKASATTRANGRLTMQTNNVWGISA